MDLYKVIVFSSFHGIYGCNLVVAANENEAIERIKQNYDSVSLYKTRYKVELVDEVDGWGIHLYR
jgi:hypothetical protein